MYARYTSHNDETLSYMEDAPHPSHTFKENCFLRRAGKKAKAKANDVGTEIVNEGKVDHETNAGSATPSTKQRERNALRYYISQARDIFHELDADINIPMIHVMAYWAEQIHQSGALQLYSAQGHKQAHKTNVKDGRNTSNYNLTYLPQVITFQYHILWFEIRELNLQDPRSALGEQRCRLQSVPFRCWSGSPPDLPGICEARIHGTPEPPWWKASWRYDQWL